METRRDRVFDWSATDALDRFQAAIEALPSGIALVSRAGNIVLANSQAERLFGFGQDELVGRPFDQLIPEARRPELLAPAESEIADQLSTPDADAIRTVGIRRDGHHFDVELRCRRVHAPSVTGAIVEISPRPARVSAFQSDDGIVGRPRRVNAFHSGVGESPATRRVMEMIEQVASTTSTVLLLGETGTGKELFASQIHERSLRRQRPMVRVNCAAIPSTLIESELFGREKGAFTGALARQVGRFELADKGTIFLDEIGDLSMDVQVKLLRVLEEGQIERLGSPHSIHIDTRIIAATHQDLPRRVAEGAFREDLYYRLNVFPIRVPALRERVEDISRLVWQFVGEFSKSFGRRIESIDADSLAALQQYPWPGNIRELRNIVERAMIGSAGTRLSIAPPPATVAADRRSLRLVDVEKRHMQAVLESTNWRIRGEGGAAARLSLKPTTLETRMARLGLKRPDHRQGTR